MIFMLLCPNNPVGLQLLRPVLTLLFEVQQIEFDFSISYPGIRICQTHKSSILLTHCLDEIFISLSLM